MFAEESSGSSKTAQCQNSPDLGRPGCGQAALLGRRAHHPVEEAETAPLQENKGAGLLRSSEPSKPRSSVLSSPNPRTLGAPCCPAARSAPHRPGALPRLCQGGCTSGQAGAGSLTTTELRPLPKLGSPAQCCSVLGLTLVYLLSGKSEGDVFVRVYL